MAPYAKCPSCESDESQWDTDPDHPSMQYCKQCGHVLEDFELTNNGWDKDLYKHADTTGWTLSLKYPKTFESHSKTCRELKRLANLLQLTDEDLTVGYQYIRAFTRKHRPSSYRITANAVAYLLRKMTRRPITLRACASINGVPYLRVGKEYNRVVTVVKPEIPEGFWDPYVFLHETAARLFHLLGSYRVKEPPAFSLPRLVELAGGILQVAKADYYHAGRTAIPVVVATILLASDVLNYHTLTKRKRRSRISAAGALLDIAPSSIILRYSELDGLFRQKNDELPWNLNNPKCKDSLPFIRDVLEFEDVQLPDRPDDSDTDDEKNTDGAESDSKEENPDEEKARKTLRQWQAAVSRYNPPQFRKAEALRLQTAGMIEAVENNDPSLKTDADVQTIAYLLHHGVEKQRLLDMNKFQRRQLEHVIRYRRENPMAYNKNLDNPLLDDSDLSAAEAALYLRTAGNGRATQNT